MSGGGSGGTEVVWQYQLTANDGNFPHTLPKTLKVWMDYEEEHSRILEDSLGGAMDSSDPERRLNAKTELTIYGTTYTVDCWAQKNNNTGFGRPIRRVVVALASSPQSQAAEGFGFLEECFGGRFWVDYQDDTLQTLLGACADGQTTTEVRIRNVPYTISLQPPARQTNTQTHFSRDVRVYSRVFDSSKAALGSGVTRTRSQTYRDRIASLEDSKLCIVCSARPRSKCCRPCGHVALCEDCALAVMNSNQQCPICMTSVEEMMTVYIP